VTTVTDLKKISYHYLTTNFIFDFIGIVPGLVTLEMVKPLYYLKLLRYIEINKFFEQIKYVLLKLSKVLTFLNKKSLENILLITKTLFALLFLIHILSCFWVLIGNTENGWWKNENSYHGDFGYLHAYPIAIYFTTATLSTVGYGEFAPVSNFEITIVMILELIGLAVFSYVLSIFSSIDVQKSAHTIIIKKQEQIRYFLNDLNDARKDIPIPREVYDDSIKAIGSTYKYNIKYLLGMFSFFEQIRPQSRKEVAFVTLK
jgi:hypothetical protein